MTTVEPTPAFSSAGPALRVRQPSMGVPLALADLGGAREVCGAPEGRRTARGDPSGHHGTRTSARSDPTLTHCPHGHAYDEANTYVDPRGYRMCRTCRRDGEARRRARRAKKPPLTPEQRSMSARAAAYDRHAQHDPRPLAAKASAAFLAKFEQQVDPEGRLDAEQRRKRALSARKAHFARLQLASSKARAWRGRACHR